MTEAWMELLLWGVGAVFVVPVSIFVMVACWSYVNSIPWYASSPVPRSPTLEQEKHDVVP